MITKPIDADMNTILAAQIDSIRTLKDKSLKITLESQELTAEVKAELMSYEGLIKVLISDSNIVKEVITEVDNLELETGENKSPSQRLRNVLYRVWEQNQSGYDDFNLFYRNRMEKIINQLKERLQ